MSKFDINNPKIIEKEKRDFETAKKIFTQIFSNTQKQLYLEFEQQPAASVSDMRFKVHHPNGNVTFYNVEIKSRNCCIADCEGLPLTVNKYCNLKDDTKEWERLIYVSLVNDEEYYIYDLDKVNMNKVIIRHWYINDIEYSEHPTKKKIPTIFFPTSQACYNGLIN